MASSRYEKEKLKEIQKALKRFPKIVALKKKRYKDRQKFLKKTFGPLVKYLRAEQRRLYG